METTSSLIHGAWLFTEESTAFLERLSSSSATLTIKLPQCFNASEKRWSILVFLRGLDQTVA